MRNPRFDTGASEKHGFAVIVLYALVALLSFQLFNSCAIDLDGPDYTRVQECEYSEIAWNRLIQCPDETEIKCTLGGVEVHGCTFKGQLCVEACSQ